MFCACENRFGAEPNTLTCPLCLGHPGVLPVINQAAVDKAIQIGLALDCEIAPQLTVPPQELLLSRQPQGLPDHPVRPADLRPRASWRWTAARIGITRAHLEEDAAKLVHAGGAGGRIAGADFSLVDFNRCGTPLVEIVTEPDIRSPEQAVRVPGAAQEHAADDRRERLRHGEGVAAVRRQRVGAAASARQAFGTKTELKNMNSFKFLGEGMAAEIERQIELLDGGGDGAPGDASLRPADRSLHARRSKEEADDYRYFPEPDLVPLRSSSAALIDAVREHRCPSFRRRAGPVSAAIRAVRPGCGRPQRHARDRGDYFEAVVAAGADPKAASDCVRNQPGGRRRPGARADRRADPAWSADEHASPRPSPSRCWC